ncbi:hypothetical protein [Actinoplanes sp. NPDC049316]|uniref:hypothetical protein n=1 Tax=Actinoplanes sp. NPDC049316 TaxID=3154727 RepID=UPI00342511E0
MSTGELRVEVAERVALADLPTVHARAGAGELPGKIVVLAPTAPELTAAPGGRNATGAARRAQLRTTADGQRLRTA